jgi:hypothetical protein
MDMVYGVESGVLLFACIAGRVAPGRIIGICQADDPSVFVFRTPRPVNHHHRISQHPSHSSQ